MAKAIDPELAQKFRDKIQQNIKDGAKTKEEYRKGIPSKFIAKDGKEYSLTGVSNYARTSQNENVKTENPSFKSIAGSKRNTERRKASREEQMAQKRKSGFTTGELGIAEKEIQSYSRIGNIEKNLGKLEAHHVRMLQMYSPFFEGMSTAQKAELAQFALDNKYALGDDISNRAMLSKPFHDKIHAFMRERGYQVSTRKIKAGYKFPGVPDLGNTMESRKNALLHFFKNVQEPIEAKLADIKFDQHDAIRPMTKAEIDQAVYEFNHPDERLTFDQRKARLTDSKWDWQQNKVHKYIETTELGRPLGGIGDTMKVGGKVRTADAVARIGTDLATGNYLGAGATAGTLGAMQLLGNKSAQKAIGGQIARLIGRQGAKTAAKAVPGLDIWLSLKDAQHYLRQGKLDQAGIAALSGAIGWVPVIGDGAAAALDFSNTGIDISRMQVPTTKKKKVIKAKPGFTPTRRLKVGI